MNKYYTIIIPIFNESAIIPNLLSDLKRFKNKNVGHEIIIIDDGSTDDSFKKLSKYKFIKLIKLHKNHGKGIALKIGINNASNEKLILFDGDRELKTDQIKKLMILEKKRKVGCVIANRKMKNKFDNMLWVFGNRFFTFLFNIIHKSNLKDALCCAKGFYKSDLSIEKLKSSKFDIDVEIASQLIKSNKTIKNISLDYSRRNKNQGKKLRLQDGFRILYRILTC